MFCDKSVVIKVHMKHQCRSFRFLPLKVIAIPLVASIKVKRESET